MKRVSLAVPSGVVAVVLFGGLILGACGSSTPAITTSTTSTTLLEHQPARAIWPFYNSGIRYITPQAAASTFATQYVGMTAPLIGTFTSSGVSTGSVDVRPGASAPVTTVQVAQVTGDGTWWVLSASTPDIVVTTPANLDTISSPISTSGQSFVFEARVPVTVRADGSLLPLGNDFVMGGSTSMGPFAKAIPFSATAATDGALIFFARSMKDGSITEATVVRLHF